ncbi:hypothetical protein VUR80DRAFT_4840 [Thermomyces stellatus]
MVYRRRAMHCRQLFERSRNITFAATNYFPSRPHVRGSQYGLMGVFRVPEPTFPDDWLARLDERDVVHDALVILQIEKVRPTVARATEDPTCKF